MLPSWYRFDRFRKSQAEDGVHVPGCFRILSVRCTSVCRRLRKSLFVYGNLGRNETASSRLVHHFAGLPGHTAEVTGLSPLRMKRRPHKESSSIRGGSGSRLVAVGRGRGCGAETKLGNATRSGPSSERTHAARHLCPRGIGEDVEDRAYPIASSIQDSQSLNFDGSDSFLPARRKNKRNWFDKVAFSLPFCLKPVVKGCRGTLPLSTRFQKKEENE